MSQVPAANSARPPEMHRTRGALPQLVDVDKEVNYENNHGITHVYSWYNSYNSDFQLDFTTFYIFYNPLNWGSLDPLLVVTENTGNSALPCSYLCYFLFGGSTPLDPLAGLGRHQLWSSLMPACCLKQTMICKWSRDNISKKTEVAGLFCVPGWIFQIQSWGPLPWKSRSACIMNPDKNHRHLTNAKKYTKSMMPHKNPNGVSVRSVKKHATFPIGSRYQGCPKWPPQGPADRPSTSRSQLQSRGPKARSRQAPRARSAVRGLEGNRWSHPEALRNPM